MLTSSQTELVRMYARIAFAGIEAAITVSVLAGCAPTYSPDTYASNAVQVANKVDQGIIVGIRAVLISADPTTGIATLGAAGGIAGSQVGGGATSALGALGGTVAGGVVGNVVSHSTGDTTGFEYIVRKPNGDLLSVTQKDPEPLGLGQHVLIIQGPQARIVTDYTVPFEDKTPHDVKKPDAAKSDVAKPEAAPEAHALVTEAPVPAAPVTATPLPAPPLSAPPATDAPKTDDKTAEPGPNGN
jgi:outer membrane lipoprotein SlyB